MPSAIPPAITAHGFSRPSRSSWGISSGQRAAPGAIERVLAPNGPYSTRDLVAATWSMERPVLPAPHQVAGDLAASVADRPLDSPRNLLFHAGVTAEATLVGFVLGTLLGVALVVIILAAP